MPTPRRISPARSASIRTCGSSRPKIAPGDTSWIGSCIDALTLTRLTLAPLALDALGERAETRPQPGNRGVAQAGGLAVRDIGLCLYGRCVGFCLRAPQRHEPARGAAI